MFLIGKSTLKANLDLTVEIGIVGGALGKPWGHFLLFSIWVSTSLRLISLCSTLLNVQL